MKIAEKFFLVELDNGEQEFFDAPYDAFAFAKRCENKRRNSVEYVACGSFYGEADEVDGVVYRGQFLRFMLRSLDNTVGWVKTVSEVLNDREEDDEDS
jgi:hypothetical protein